jgi:hypothetical protein
LVNIIDNSNATYSIPYTDEELADLVVEMTGEVYDTEYEFGYDTVRIKRTRNAVNRWWGGVCADIAGWAISQNKKYGDYYMIIDEEYSSKKIIELEAIQREQN